MKLKAILTTFILITMHTQCRAIDPVLEYKQFSGLSSNDTLYQWEIDLNGDSRKVIFLTTKADYQETRHDGVRPVWTVYLPDTDGLGHFKTHGIENGYGLSPVSDVGIDEKLMFIGLVTQIGKNGIVTAQQDRGKKEVEAVTYIYAYTMEGDHIKETLLAKYNPAEPNAIYEQYLIDAKRTHITLQVVSP